MRLMLGICSAVLCLTACVCTPGKNSPSAGAAPDSSASDARAAKGPVMGDKDVVQVKLTPLADGQGYRLGGLDNLAGTLVYSDGQWQLDASFEFPTAGYSVKDLEVAVLKRLPEEVHITIPYQPPPIDALVAQAVTAVPVTWSGVVGEKATFKISVKRIPPETAARAGK